MMVQLLGQMGVGGRVKEDTGEILDLQKTFHLDFSASEKYRQSPQTQRHSKLFAVDKELSLEPRHPCFTAAGRLAQDIISTPGGSLGPTGSLVQTNQLSAGTTERMAH